MILLYKIKTINIKWIFNNNNNKNKALKNKLIKHTQHNFNNSKNCVK